MKIALCLYGHLRSYKQCLPSLIDNVIIPYNPDIFAMTWMDSLGSNTQNFENARYNIGYDTSDPKVEPSIIQYINGLIKPVDWHLDHFLLYKNDFIKIIDNGVPWQFPILHHRPLGTLGSSFSRYVTLKMKRQKELMQNWDYDFVIATRWDVFFKEKIEFDRLVSNAVVMNAYFDKISYETVKGDFVVCGSSKNMDVWGNCFEMIPILPKIGKPTLCPHNLVEQLLIENNVEINYNIYLGSKIDLIRNIQ